MANGDLNAHAATHSGDPLLQLAVSLNLTLDRLARTSLSALSLQALEQEVAALSQDVAELAQVGLRYPAFTQQMRRLVPLAYSLEQLRIGILQAIQYARSMVDQIGADLNGIGQHVQQHTLLGLATVRSPTGCAPAWTPRRPTPRASTATSAASSDAPPGLRPGHAALHRQPVRLHEPGCC